MEKLAAPPRVIHIQRESPYDAESQVDKFLRNPRNIDFNHHVPIHHLDRPIRTPGRFPAPEMDRFRREEEVYLNGRAREMDKPPLPPREVIYNQEHEVSGFETELKILGAPRNVTQKM